MLLLLLPVTAGVRQGDSLSPTLFSIFVNDLADDVREKEAGVYVGGLQIPILLYADDVVLISPNAHGLQCQLDALNTWCNRWCMDINQAKSQILHVRHHQKPRDTTDIKWNE